MKIKQTIMMVFVLCACRENSKKDVPGTPYNPEDYYQSTIIKSVDQLDSSKVYLLGQDDRKTWRCEFYSNRFLIITNKLRDTFVVRNDLSYQIKNNILLNPFKLSSPEEKFSIEILPETCEGRTDNEAVFSDTTKKIVIDLNKRLMTGCISQLDSASTW